MTIQLTITATVVTPDSTWSAKPEDLKKELEGIAGERVKNWFKGYDCKTNVTATATPDEDTNPKA